MEIARLRPIVAGEAMGRAVKVESLSFYGEVDPVRGVLIGSGKPVKDRILVIGRSRGSTVGSYIIYALKYYNNKPKAIIMIKSEPIVITGSILAGIPLYEGLPQRAYQAIRDNDCLKVSATGVLEIIEGC